MTRNPGTLIATGSVFAPYAVYTILHADTLKRIAQQTRPQLEKETKRWVTGSQEFEKARRQGQKMAILYADANHCSRLLYWGLITDLNVASDGTRYTVVDLIPLSRRKTQELVLKSTDKRIAKGFIKPYAIVHTPAYIDSHGARVRAEKNPRARAIPELHSTKRGKSSSRKVTTLGTISRKKSVLAQGS